MDVLADFIQNWLEDNINPELFENIQKTVDSLKTLEQFNEDTIELFSIMLYVQ